MQININLSEEQIKALLTYYKSIESYVQSVVENRANRLIEVLVKDYAKGRFEVEGITIAEQNIIDTKLANKIVVQPDQLADEVKQIIVRRSKVKSMVEKIAEQKLLEKPIAIEK